MPWMDVRREEKEGEDVVTRMGAALDTGQAGDGSERRATCIR